MTHADVIRAHYAASDRGDLDGMLAPLAANCAWTEAAGFPLGGTYHGPDEVRTQVFHRIGAEWDEFRFTLDEVVDGGDVVIGIGTYSGTYRATGASMSARVAHVWRLSGGEVVAFEQFADTSRVAEALAS